MPIKLRQNWALPESAVTPEHIYMTRRQWLQAAGFAGAGLAANNSSAATATKNLFIAVLP